MNDKTVKCNFHQLTILRQLIIYDFLPKLSINLFEYKSGLLLYTVKLKTQPRELFCQFFELLHKIALKKVK